MVEDYALVRSPHSREPPATIKGGPLPRHPLEVLALEVLALEGGTTRAAVARVVEMLDNAKPMVRLDFAV